MSKRKRNRTKGVPTCKECGRKRFKTVSLHYPLLKHIRCRHCNAFKCVVKA